MLLCEKKTTIDHYVNEIKKLEFAYNMLNKSSELKRKQTMNAELEKKKIRAEMSKFKQIINKKESEIK